MDAAATATPRESLFMDFPHLPVHAPPRMTLKCQFYAIFMTLS